MNKRNRRSYSCINSRIYVCRSEETDIFADFENFEQKRSSSSCIHLILKVQDYDMVLSQF
jgi:hypothetical protein